MTPVKKISVAAVMIAIVGGGGYAIYKKNQPPTVAYREVKVERRDINLSVLSTGTVAPENRVDIKAPVAGRAEKVLVHEGQAVKKGQVLVWMSSAERAALIDAATAKGPDEVKRWEDIYRPTPVIAPINGVVIVRNIESGQTFATTDAMLTMSDRLTVKAQVDETDLAKVKVNQDATIMLDAYPTEKIAGKVDRIAYDSTTTNNVTIYYVYVLPNKTPDTMRSGMTANVTFLTEKRDKVLSLPAEAITTAGETNSVLVKGPDGSPVSRTVEVGLSDGKTTEILSGLTEADTVMIKKIILDKKSQTTNPFMPTRVKTGKAHL
jgi:macrolide-specific efflux system membrane fusion protein